MRILNLNRKLKSAKRLPEIVSIFARHGFGHIISQIFERGRTRRFRLKSVFTPKAREDTHSPETEVVGFPKCEEGFRCKYFRDTLIRSGAFATCV